MTLLAHIRTQGLSLNHAGYFLRLIALKVRYGKRVSWRSWTVSLQPSVQVSIEGESSVRFGAWTHIRRGCDLEAYAGATIAIGDRFFMNKNSSIVARYGIRIGSDCLFADHVSIYDHNHAFHQAGIATREQGFTGRPIQIGNNVWIGSKAFIGAGVTIGDNCVIGANAVIVRDVPSNTVAYSQVRLAMKPVWGVDRSGAQKENGSSGKSVVNRPIRTGVQ